jgi:hypothetical protein
VAFKHLLSNPQFGKRVLATNPHFFDQYSHVWVCDDDIQMSGEDVGEAFAIAERFGYWVAQPAFFAIIKFDFSHLD